MSEYWKSTPKYWCKHCSAYVKDTPFERRQHENTAKHQNNLKRFLRDIQNDHERTEREKQRAKDEVERLNRLTGGSSAVANTSAPVPTFQSAKSGPLTAADQKRQWQQLATMGINVPEEYRSDMAMVGDWKTISRAKHDELPAEEPLSSGIRKRKLEDDEGEEEEEPQDLSTEPRTKSIWGKSTKRYPGGTDDDLDALLSSTVRLKKEEQDIKADKGARSPDLETAVTTEANVASAHPVTDKPTPIAEGVVEPPAKTVAKPPTEEPDTAVKAEVTSLGETASPLGDIPEANPIPVFKRRKAKSTK